MAFDFAFDVMPGTQNESCRYRLLVPAIAWLCIGGRCWIAD